LPSGSEFGQVTAATIEELTRIFGVERIVSEPRALARYGRDQVFDPRYGHPADVAVKPETTEQIQELMLFASRESIPVTPRGAGSGLSGGAVPVRGGIVVSFEKMNRILEIDTRNLIAVVEPGVVTNRLDEALSPHGLFFAGYPLSEEYCFIGGNVAENAGGGRAVKYGVASRYVTGLEIVTPAGEIIQIGGKRYKDVTGLDLLGLLTGSEGTLALFSKVFLRVLPRPKARSIARISFGSESDALAVVPEIVADSDIAPSAVEFLDGVCLSVTERYLKSESPAGDKAMLFVEIDGADSTAFSERFARLEALVRSQSRSIIEIVVSDDDASMERLWQIRKQVPWALKKMNPMLTAEDIVVPPAESRALLDFVRELGQTYGVMIPFFGHAGDGNYHASPMKPDSISDDEWPERLRELLTELYTHTASLGGTISGEHGIGHKRIEYLPLVLDPAHRALLARIKHAFDPQGILNPGKLYA